MSTFLEKGKKLATLGVAVTTITWTLGLAAFAPLATNALTLTAGDLIQGSGKAVYWFTSDGKRMPFPNQKVYNSWFQDFSGVKKITDAELAAIPLAGTNVTYRPGTRLVKITTDPKTYAVEPGGSLRWIKTEADATTLYGSNWAKMIDDVPDVFFTNYTVGAALDTPMLTDGRLVKTADSSDIYVVWGGKLRKVADYAAFTANHFNSDFVVTVDKSLTSALPAGDPVTGAEAALTMPASVAAASTTTPPTTTTTTTSPATGKSLTVMLATDTPPAAVHASGSAYNKALKVELTAGSDGDVQISQLVVSHGGLVTNSAFTTASGSGGLGVFTADGTRHGNFVSFNDPDSTYATNHAVVTFSGSDAITVPAGKTIDLWLETNITTAAAGQSGTYNLFINKASDITANAGATVSGTFPVTGSTFSLTNGANVVGTFTVDAVQVYSNGAGDATVVNENLGVKDQEIGRFRFAAGANEDMNINKVTLYNNGNSSDGDLTSLRLKGPDGTVLATVPQTTSRYVTFDLSSKPYLLAKGTSRDFSLTADITSGSTRTARFVIQNDYDTQVSGASSGSNILPTAAGNNDTAFPIGDIIGASYVNKITIAAGTLLFSKSTDAPTGNISAGGNQVVLGKWDITAVGEDMEIRGMNYNITRSAATNLGGTLKIMVNGATVYSVSGSSATYGADTAAALSSYPLLKAGQKATITAVSDILSTATSGLTYNVALDVTSVHRISTNDILDPGVAETGANTLTIAAASLSLAKGSMGDTNVVSGQTGARVASFSLSAGSTEAVDVSSLTVGLSNVTNVANLTLKDPSMAAGTTLAPAVATPSASNSLSISGFTIPASGTKTVDVYLDTNSATTTTEVVTLTVSNAIGDASHVTVTATGSPSTGPTVTFGSSGSLTLTLNASSSPSAQLLHSQMTDVTLANINFKADNFEDINLKTLELSVNNGQSSVADGTMKLYDGSTMVGSGTSVIGGLAVFGGLNYTIPRDSTKTLTVKLSTTASGTINSNSTLSTSIAYVEATGKAGGATIKPGTSNNTTWTAGAIAAGGTALTVGSNDGFQVGDIVYADNTAVGGELALVTAVTGTTSVTVGGAALAAGTTLNKLATGATTAASAGTVTDAGVAVTVTSTRGFSVGDPVYVYNATDGGGLGWVTAVGSSTSMTIRSLVAAQGAAASRVSKLGAGSPVTTGWTAGTPLAVTGTALTVGSTTGFNVGDAVLAQCTGVAGTFGVVTAVGSTTSMTVNGNAAVALTGTCNIVRIGTDSTALVSTAASTTTPAIAGAAITVTSTTGFGVGDVVMTTSTSGAILGDVTAVTPATPSVTVQSAAAGGGAATRMTRLPGAASVSRAMSVQDVYPTLAIADGSPSGAKSPTSSQEVARLAVTASGDRDLSFSQLRLRKSGSNSPAQYVTTYNLYITGASSPLSTVGTTTITGTTGTGATAGTTVTFCAGATDNAVNELSLISAGEFAHMNVGDTLTFDDGSATTVTVTAKTYGANGTAGYAGAACAASTATLTFSATPSISASTATNIYSDTVYFDSNTMSNNASVTDVPMASQTITQGSTMTLSVYANTSAVRTGLTTQTASFNLSVPGANGPEPTGVDTSTQAGGLSWSYTPSGAAAAVTSTAANNYQSMNFGTLTY